MQSLDSFYASLSLQGKALFPNRFWVNVLTPEGRKTFELFVGTALKAKKMQHRNNFGAKAIIEVMRWDRAVKGMSDVDMFKLNNTYTSAFARLAMLLEPRLKGFFETRRSQLDALTDD